MHTVSNKYEFDPENTKKKSAWYRNWIFVEDYAFYKATEYL